MSRRSRTPLSILIVEDERELGRVLFDYLAEIGHRPEVLYIEQQGRRVDVAGDACREFIGHLGSLLAEMKTAAPGDQPHEGRAG